MKIIRRLKFYLLLIRTTYKRRIRSKRITIYGENRTNRSGIHFTITNMLKYCPVITSIFFFFLLKAIKRFKIALKLFNNEKPVLNTILKCDVKSSDIGCTVITL